jgi:hypothetical protein
MKKMNTKEKKREDEANILVAELGQNLDLSQHPLGECLVFKGRTLLNRDSGSFWGCVVIGRADGQEHHTITVKPDHPVRPFANELQTGVPRTYVEHASSNSLWLGHCRLCAGSVYGTAQSIDARRRCAKKTSGVSQRIQKQ